MIQAGCDLSEWVVELGLERGQMVALEGPVCHGRLCSAETLSYPEKLLPLFHTDLLVGGFLGKTD